ncbi:MAG: DUF6481 family protein [Ferrovibrio sp.]|jgi:hypothetical protein
MKDKDGFAERLGTAAAARKALLDKARALNPANDPDFAARQAARLEASRRREAAEAERKAARLADAERKTAEREAAKAAAEAAAKAEQEALEAARAAKANVKVKSEAELKAARDARYAARKARRK